jgi:hypothetical protein
VGYSMVHVDDLPEEGPGGAVRFVRRQLGAEAFGINWFEFAPNVSGFEHNEQETQQEEVNMTIVAVGARKGSYEPRGNF